MKRRRDVTSLVMGLIFALVAAIGVWSAIGPFDWSLLTILLPVCLVVVGLVGLSASRSHP